MNLLNDKWIPILRMSGKSEDISPHQIITDQETDPVLSICSPYPHFDAALLQFLIGLFQWMELLEDEEDLMDLLISPPSPNEVSDKLNSIKHAFELFDDKTPFMQENPLDGGSFPIEMLGLERPGENTRKLRTDWFYKHDEVKGVHPHAAAMMLLSAQAFAPQSGSGYKVSIRGSSPLSTIIEIKSNPQNSDKPPTLWHQIAVNLLDSQSMESLTADKSKNQLSDIFPWMEPERFVGKSIHPQDAHPLQAYFAMPQRFKLELSDNSGNCSLTGKHTNRLIESFIKTKKGVDYQLNWIHPLCPIQVSDKDGRYAMRKGAVGHRNWPVYAMTLSDTSEPAPIVSQNLRNFDLKGEIQINAEKAEFKNNDFMRWQQAQMPLFHLEEGENRLLKEVVDQLLEGNQTIIDITAEHIRSFPKHQANSNLFSKKDRPSVKAKVSESLWQRSESRFYETLSLVIEKIAEGTHHPEDFDALRDQFRKDLIEQALEEFKKWIIPLGIGESERDQVLALNGMNRSLRGSLIRKKMGMSLNNEEKVAA